jgi:hypothetical protein
MLPARAALTTSEMRKDVLTVPPRPAAATLHSG